MMGFYSPNLRLRPSSDVHRGSEPGLGRSRRGFDTVECSIATCGKACCLVSNQLRNGYGIPGRQWVAQAELPVKLTFSESSLPQSARETACFELKATWKRVAKSDRYDFG